MAEEIKQEETNAKQQSSLSKTVSKMGKSVSHFLKHLYGKNIEDAQKGEPKPEPQQGTEGQGQQTDLAQLINEKTKEVESETGLSFKQFETDRGGKGLVLVDTTGKNRGGAFPTRANIEEGRIDDKTSFQGDEFVSKNNMLKIFKSLGDAIKGFDTNGKIAEMASKGGEKLPDKVSVDPKQHVVSLPRALTTTLVVALFAASITGFAMMPKGQNTPTPTPDSETVFVLPGGEEITNEELAKELLEDAGPLIQEHGEIAKDIKGYNQEKWEERRLSGGGASTETERIENENAFEQSLVRRNEFKERQDKIEQDYANGVIDERQYVIQSMELTRDVYQANSEISKDCEEAIDGASKETEGHMNSYYKTPSEGREQHEFQLAEYDSDKVAAQEKADAYAAKAEQYDQVIKTAQSTPDLSAEDIKMLLEAQIEAQSQGAAAQNATGMESNDVGMEQ